LSIVRSKSRLPPAPATTAVVKESTTYLPTVNL
jgi:hypothetical protein